MSRAIYGDSRIIPCPYLQLNKSYNLTDDGTPVGSTWQISILGKSLVDMGSPDRSGNFWTAGGYPPDDFIEESSRLSVLFRKQEGIRRLFSSQGLALSFQADDASAPLTFYPTIKEINFNRDLWFQFVEYEIICEAPVIYGLNDTEDFFSGYLKTANESWDIETSDDQPESVLLPRTYRISHNVSAQGQRFYSGVFTDAGKRPWEYARDWVQSRLGLDGTIILSSGALNLPDFYGGYNLIRSENIDEYGGTYSVTENWVLASGKALETFEISVKKSNQTSITSVSIDGTITGLEQRNPNTLNITSYKYDNAMTQFTYASGQALSRAQNYSNETLNIDPLNSVVGKSIANGIITYSYEYDTRPSNLVPTAKSEIISINDSLGTDVVAIVPVLGRAKGPVLQNIGTSKERRRTLDIELIMPVPSLADIGAAINDLRPTNNPVSSGVIGAIISAANPINNGASKSFLDENTERWQVKEGIFSVSKTWVYEN